MGSEKGRNKASWSSIRTSIVGVPTKVLRGVSPLSPPEAIIFWVDTLVFNQAENQGLNEAPSVKKGKAL